MTNMKFPFPRLPNGLCLKVLKTMDPQEIIVYSFVSKNTLSLVKTLHLPITSIRILMNARPQIFFEFGDICIKFELKMGWNYETMISLNDLPVNVKVLTGKIERKLELTMSNQGMSFGEWIQHLCSFTDKVKLYEGDFHVGHIHFDIQTLRKTFPKLRNIVITCFREETEQRDVFYAQTILKAFLPDVQNVELWRVPLQEKLSLQHIGMANLKQLGCYRKGNMNIDCLFTWNFESCIINTDRMPLCDLNRFFKLWKKGSNPKLKELILSFDTEIDTNWNVLLKGLKAEEVEREERSMKYIIKNCRGVSAEIEICHFEEEASIEFTVSN